MNQHTNQLNEFVDMIVAYKLIKILTTNFEDTDAFKLGVIDVSHSFRIISKNIEIVSKNYSKEEKRFEG